MVKIYKYFGPEDYNVNALLGGNVWLSSPFTFNDPYDSRLRISSPYDEDVLQIITEILFSGSSDYITSDVIGDIMSPRENSNNKPIFTEIIYWALRQNNQSLDNLIKLINFHPKFKHQAEISTFFHHCYCLGIACFSKIKDDLAMWAHYTKNHKGFCVEYDYEPFSINNNPQYIKDVHYVNTFPSVIYSDNCALSCDDVLTQICSKSTSWSYEQEVRFIDMVRNDELVKFPGKITGVCMGMEMDKKLRSTLIDLLPNRILHSASLSSIDYKICWEI